MEQRDYYQILNNIFDSVTFTFETLKKCLYNSNTEYLQNAQKEVRTTLKASLPHMERIMQKTDRSEPESRLVGVLPILQMMGIGVEDLVGAVTTKVKTDTVFTDKALREVDEIMASVKDLVRDTRDLISTGNPRLRQEVRSEAETIFGKIGDCSLEHQQRLISGLCTPKASFIYLDLIDCIKRVAKQLVYLSEKA